MIPNTTVNPLGPGAAEVIGLDCAQAFAPEILAQAKKIWGDYPVLVFRDQSVTPKQFAAFGRQFGPLETYNGAGGTAALPQTGARETPDQVLYQSPEDPDVLIMTNERHEKLPVIGVVDNAEIWHSDASHKPEPYKAIAVHVLRNPAAGGDTDFCDLRAVYDALTPEIKAALNGRTAVHHWSKALNPRFAGHLDDAAREEGLRIAKMIPPAHQPLVRTHPETGRPALYLSPRFTLAIDGVDPQLSHAMLEQLFAFADDPAFCYRHEWREGDLMLWDNRCTNHRVRGYDAADIRRRYRITISGDRAF